MRPGRIALAAVVSVALLGTTACPPPEEPADEPPNDRPTEEEWQGTEVQTSLPEVHAVVFEPPRIGR